MNPMSQNQNEAQLTARLRRKQAAVLATILVLGTVGSSNGFDPPTNSGSPAPPSELSSQVVQEITDTNVPVSERLAIFHRVLEHGSGNRDAVSVDVVRYGDEAVASEAAIHLVQPTTPMNAEAAGVIAKRMVEWRDYTQRSLLQQIASSADNRHLMIIPRALLESMIVRGEPPTTDLGSQTTAVDLAAWILAKSNDPKDDDLLRRAVANAPHSRDLWVCLLQRRALTDGENALARRVYKDGAVPLVARVAAAVAVAGKDKEAFDFAMQSINGLLAEFGDLGLDSIGPSYNDERIAIRHHRMKEDLVAVAMLIFIDDPRAEEMTFRWVNSRNPYMNRVIGLVAARRWPERFLRDVRDSEFEQDYALSLAAVAYFHPEFSSQVAERIPGDELRGPLEIVRKRAVAGEADRFVLGW